MFNQRENSIHKSLMKLRFPFLFCLLCPTISYLFALHVFSIHKLHPDPDVCQWYKFYQQENWWEKKGEKKKEKEIIQYVNVCMCVVLIFFFIAYTLS